MDTPAIGGVASCNAGIRCSRVIVSLLSARVNCIIQIDNSIMVFALKRDSFTISKNLIIKIISSFLGCYAKATLFSHPDKIRSEKKWFFRYPMRSLKRTLCRVSIEN